MIVTLPGVEGRCFEVGLYWHSLEQASLRDIARTEAHARYCRVGSSVAFREDDGNKGKSGRGSKRNKKSEPLMVCVAAALGEGRCAVVLDEVNAQKTPSTQNTQKIQNTRDDPGEATRRWWLAVILDGLVIQDELFASRADARGRLAQLQRVHGALAVDLWVGQAPADADDASSFRSATLPDLLAESGKLSWRRAGSPAGLIVCLLLAAICLGVGYLYVAPGEKGVDATWLHQQRLGAARAEHERITHQVLGRAPAGLMLPLYRDWLNADRYVSRWRRESMACGTVHCRSVWAGLSGARISVLHARYATAQLAEESLSTAMTSVAIAGPVQYALTPDRRPLLAQFGSLMAAQDFCQTLLHRGASSCQVTSPVAVWFQGSELLPPDELTRTGFLELELPLPAFSAYWRWVQRHPWLRHESIDIAYTGEPAIHVKHLFVMKGGG